MHTFLGSLFCNCIVLFFHQFSPFLIISTHKQAFAKYYGNYGLLEKGYVHQALQDLTGCEAECIPLSGPSRGIGKRALWDSLVRYVFFLFKSEPFIVVAFLCI